jgi:hypothetical protein
MEAAIEEGEPAVIPAPLPEAATPELQPQPQPPVGTSFADEEDEEDEEELTRFRSLPDLEKHDYTAELVRVTSTKSERRFQLGVTEYFFPWLRKLVADETGEELAAVTTEQLVWGKKNTGPSGPGPITWCITAACEAEQCSFAAWCAQRGHTHDAAGKALFAPVTTFASHAWAGSFVSLVDALDQHSAAVRQTQETEAAFFLDIVVINQFVPPWKETPALDAAQCLRPPIEFCKCTLLVLTPFDKPIPLTRSWCIYEIHTTQRLGATLDIRIPSNEQQRFATALAAGEFDFNDWVLNIDIEQAQAVDERTKSWILEMVRREVGVASLNRSVVSMLCEWLCKQGEAALALLPAQERKTSALMANMADMLWRQGKAAEAEPLLREIVTDRQEVLGLDHERTHAGMYTLAKCLRTRGDVAASETMLHELVELQTQHPEFGADHHATLSSRRELAVLWRVRAGELSRAQTELRAVVSTRRRLINHAEQVEELSEETLKPLRAALCDDLYALTELLLCASGGPDSASRLSTATDLVDEVIESRTKLLGERHAHTFDARVLRGQVRVASGSLCEEDVAEARAVLDELKKMLGTDKQPTVAQTSAGLEHHKTLRCKLLLAQMLDAQKEYEEAAQLAAEAAEGCRAAFGESHPDTLVATQAHRTIADRAEQSSVDKQVTKQELGLEPEPEPTMQGGILVSVGSKVKPDESVTCPHAVAERPDYCAVLETRGTGEAKISWLQTWQAGCAFWSDDDGSSSWVDVDSLRTKTEGHRCTGVVTEAPPDDSYWDTEAQRWASIPPSPSKQSWWDPVELCWQHITLCFTGAASVLLMDGTTKLAQDVQVGDMLATKHTTDTDHVCATTVTARLIQPTQPRLLIQIGELKISAVHRIVHDGQWIEPPLYPGAKVVLADEALFNFVVEGCLPIVVNDICVSTVGTHCEGSHDFQWPTHALWGSRNVVDILRQHPSWCEKRLF